MVGPLHRNRILIVLAVAVSCATLVAPPAAGATAVSAHVGGRWSVRPGWWGWPYYPHPYPYRPYWYAPLHPVYRPVLAAVPAGSPPALLRTDIRPKRATVVVDGSAMGEARRFDGPYEGLYLTPGPHVLEFVHPGYQRLRVQVEARSGSVLRIEERLQAGGGLDPRSSPEPSPPPAPAGAAGSHRPPDPADSPERTPSAQPGGPPSPAPGASDAGELRAGRLRILVTPPDAVVYLDGRFLARAEELERLHGALPVAAGEHTLEVVRPGYQSARREIRVEPGGELEERIDLVVSD